jgi:hypothetical protein
MPQPQQSIALVFVNNPPATGIASGNNAAWICTCDRKNPLVGHSCDPLKPENDRVDCPNCGKKFFVIGESARFSKAIEIREVADK